MQIYQSNKEKNLGKNTDAITTRIKYNKLNIRKPFNKIKTKIITVELR